ncbi:MAG: hypothetical protein GXP55_07130 [Deltaproteobacteria bacterium]|nr:hypothetical protein [Deltaproteobacteria bacterium]
MPIILEAEGRSLQIQSADGGACHLVWVGADGERVDLGEDETEDLCGRLVKSLERALSDEFTVVGSIQGVPILHLLALERTMIYLSMDQRHLYVQDDENRPIGELPVDESSLQRWTTALRRG